MPAQDRMRVAPRPFGRLPSGEAVDGYTLSHPSGMALEILTYGAILRALRVPDRDGTLADVVLGFDDLDSYTAGRAYHGALVGRIAGRVSGGRLTVGGRVHALTVNEGMNHLHGGARGLDRRVWEAQVLARDDGAPSLRLTTTSGDGEEGYPGTLTVSVTYTLARDHAVEIETEATADRATAASLTQHAYFNLGGEASGDVLGHDVAILADAFVPTDASMTLSDRREGVAGHGADLRRARRLGDALPGLFQAHGDLYLLRGTGAAPPPAPTLAARVAEPKSGRVLEVWTDNPCLQFYTGVGLDGTQAGKGGAAYGPHAGLCLECEGYPNAGRVAGLGDTLVVPGLPQRRRTRLVFSTDRGNPSPWRP